MGNQLITSKHSNLRPVIRQDCLVEQHWGIVSHVMLLSILFSRHCDATLYALP